MLSVRFVEEYGRSHAAGLEDSSKLDALLSGSEKTRPMLPVGNAEGSNQEGSDSAVKTEWFASLKI